MYEIKSLENPEEGILKGKFCANELVRINISNNIQR